jgi:hypothetical protein
MDFSIKHFCDLAPRVQLSTIDNLIWDYEKSIPEAAGEAHLNVVDLRIEMNSLYIFEDHLEVPVSFQCDDNVRRTLAVIDDSGHVHFEAPPIPPQDSDHHTIDYTLNLLKSLML